MESAAHVHTQLTGLALVALAALLCGMAMQRFKQPAVAGYIIAGVILGPSSISLVQDRATIQQLAELGVLMLLFLIGMELSLRGARQVWKIALAATGLQIGVSLLAATALGGLLDWPLARVVVVGFVIAISSTAVAIKMLSEIGELRTRVGQITIGVLIAQDLAVVPMMLVVDALGQGGAFGFDALIKVGLSIVFLAILILYLSGRQRIRLPFAQLVGNSVDLTPLAGLAFCFGASAISGMLGLSAAYGAFLAGLVIGNSTSRRIMIHYTAPIQSVLLMVFFLSIGLLIDLRFIWENLATVMALVAFVTVFKTALNVGLLRLLGEAWPRAFLSGVLLAQIGEFSFVLAALGVSSGSVPPDIHRLIVAITVLSLMVSPLWLELARRLHRVALIGVTSPREIIRIVLNRETRALSRSTREAEVRVSQAAASLQDWLAGRRAKKATLPPAETAEAPEPGGPPAPTDAAAETVEVLAPDEAAPPTAEAEPEDRPAPLEVEVEAIPAEAPKPAETAEAEGEAAAPKKVVGALGRFLKSRQRRRRAAEPAAELEPESQS